MKKGIYIISIFFFSTLFAQKKITNEELFRIKVRNIESLFTQKKYDSVIKETKEIFNTNWFKKNTDNPFLFKGNKLIADSYYEKRKADLFITYMNKALYSTNNDTLKFISYDRLANIYGIKNEYGVSLKYIDSALVIANKIDIPRYNASIKFRLGKTQKLLSFYPEAEKNILEAISIGKKIPVEPSIMGNFNRELGRLYRRMERYKEAGEYYKKSLIEYEKIKRQKTIASIYDDISALLLAEKKYDSAFIYVQRAINLRKTHNIKSSAVTYSRLGRLYYLIENKNFNLSYHYLNKAKEDYLKRNRKENLMYIELYLFNHYQARKMIDSANYHINKHLKLKDSIIKSSNRKVLAEFQSKYDAEKKEKEVLKLKADNAEQALLTEKANTQKWFFGLGLFVVAIITFFTWKRYRSEAMAKEIISIQKDDIEQQKNLVEILQKDLHHRMKNNLSFIDLFINLAKARFTDKAYQEKLNELQIRMQSMFEVHVQLLNKDELATIQANIYIDSFISKVQKIHLKDNILVINQTKPDEKISSNIAFPIGLIINEFLTNSYKHAFCDKQKGSINISLSSDSSFYLLSLSDNGKGLPKNFNLDDLDSFGVDIIKDLAKEYKGSFQIKGSQGVSIIITLPKIIS